MRSLRSNGQQCCAPAKQQRHNSSGRPRVSPVAKICISRTKATVPATTTSARRSKASAQNAIGCTKACALLYNECATLTYTEQR